MGKFYLLIYNIKSLAVDGLIEKDSLDDVEDELFKIDVNLCKENIKFLLRRLSITNRIYNNESKIQSMGRIFWVFKDPHLFKGQLIFTHGEIILNEMNRILKSRYRLNNLDKIGI
jgi:hypothetical protein